MRLLSVCMFHQVEASDERIDVEQLKVRDKINFYSDLILFEDELHDSGCSMLGVKIVSLTSRQHFRRCYREVRLLQGYCA